MSIGFTSLGSTHTVRAENTTTCTCQADIRPRCDSPIRPRCDRKAVGHETGGGAANSLHAFGRLTARRHGAVTRAWVKTNPLCGNEAFKKVPISVAKTPDQKRSLCSACMEAYRWGVRHGQMRCRRKKVWVLAIADRGIVVEGQAFGSQRKAIQGLAKYLKVHEGYDGGADMAEVSEWLAEHDERMGAEIFPASLELS